MPTSIKFTPNKTELTSFDPDTFYTDYPYIYFKEKQSSTELYASGAVFIGDEYLDFQGPEKLLFFIFGSKAPSWGDLGKIYQIIPQKWVFKTATTIRHFEINHPSIFEPFTQSPHLPPSTSFQEIKRAIDIIQKNIQTKILSKCVLALTEQIEKPYNFNLKHLIDHPSLGTKYAITFGKKLTFSGITPEWLYQRQNHTVKIDAIAGTSEVPSDLNTPKIINEFSIVKQGIKEDMSFLITEGGFLEEDTAFQHHNLFHRHNIFKATLKKNSDSAILKALHPTAAICGFPKTEALNLIATLETFQRGLFAAPIGYYTQEKSSIAIALRCMLQTENTAHLFAGAGITEDSWFEDEWNELQNKLKLMQSML